MFQEHHDDEQRSENPSIVPPDESGSEAMQRSGVVGGKHPTPFVQIFRAASAAFAGFFDDRAADAVRTDLEKTHHEASQENVNLRRDLEWLQSMPGNLSLEKVHSLRAPTEAETESVRSREDLYTELKALHQELLAQRALLEKPVNEIGNENVLQEWKTFTMPLDSPERLRWIARLHEKVFLGYENKRQEIEKMEPDEALRVQKLAEVDEKIKKLQEWEEKDRDSVAQPDFTTLSERVSREISGQMGIIHLLAQIENPAKNPAMLHALERDLQNQDLRREILNVWDHSEKLRKELRDRLPEPEICDVPTDVVPPEFSILSDAQISINGEPSALLPKKTIVGHVPPDLTDDVVEEGNNKRETRSDPTSQHWKR
ncbi:MAG TPA: hypothetical protein VGZ00_00995 [Candidatus Baltobacteraceae bacterium]|nr:hypothetical protein [Candidatus Baltobacteraceae bacterium]